MENLLLKMGVKYALARLSEASTWAAIAAGMAGYLHLSFNADFKSAFVGLGLAVATLLGVIIKEGVKK